MPGHRPAGDGCSSWDWLPAARSRGDLAHAECHMSDMDELSRTVRAVVEQVLRELRASSAPPVAQPLAAAPQPPPQPDSRLIAAQPRRVAIGSDHGGYAMKEALKPFLVELG